MLRVLGFVLVFWCLSAVPALAQTGAWVSHPEDIPGNDSYLYDCGETTVILTRVQAEQILFFDTNGGAWVEQNFDARQTWTYVQAEGDLAFALCDSYAVAYNGLTATAHVLAYEGVPLRDDNDYWSYRCGRALAYLATDAYLYVFDSGSDAWQQYALTVPADFVRCNSNVGDDWVGVSLERTYGTAAETYAYSLTAHGFAYTENGPPYGPTTGFLNHGFVESNNVGSTLTFVGYSSATNTFAHEALPAGAGLNSYGSANYHGKDQRTVFAVLYSDSSSEPWESCFAAYDTRQGSWDHHVDTYYSDEHNMWTNVYVGGQYAVAVKQDRSDDALGFRVYSGLDGSFTWYWPGVYYDSTILVPGGTTFAAADKSGHMWGLSVTTGNNVLAGMPYNREWVLRTEGENFSLFGYYESGSDIMHIVVYMDNVWYGVQGWRTSTLDDTAGSHCYVRMTTGTDLRAILFSSVLGELIWETFADTDNPQWWRSDYLAYVRSSGGQGVLFDAHRAVRHHRDLDWEHDSLGEAVFVGADQGEQTAWGYSAVVGDWAATAFGETMYIGDAGRYVAWVGDVWPVHRIAAYNGFYNCWVELDMVGNASGVATGGQTLLAFHSGTAWAFDPDAPLVGTEDLGDPDDLPPPAAPQVLALHPVQPNPFNPSTRVAFDLPRSGHVRLQAFDLRGRLVCTLTDEVWPAGSHNLYWQGRDDDGGSLPSGTYLLSLETERKIVRQRAMLLK